MINPELKRVLLKIATENYMNEPCAICGRNIEQSDLETIVFARYSDIDHARAAHQQCWNGFMRMLRAVPDDELAELVVKARERPVAIPDELEKESK